MLLQHGPALLHTCLKAGAHLVVWPICIEFINVVQESQIILSLWFVPFAE